MTIDRELSCQVRVRDEVAQRQRRRDREHEVRDRPGERPRSPRPRRPPSRLLGLTGVGFAQPKPNELPMNVTARRMPAERVEMGDRVERQPSEELGRAVPEPIGRQRMGELVDRETDEQHDRDDDDARQDVVGTADPLRGPAYRSGAAAVGQRRPSRSAFLRSNSSALIAPRSRRSARLLSVRVTSSWVSGAAGWRRRQRGRHRVLAVRWARRRHRRCSPAAAGWPRSPTRRCRARTRAWRRASRA